MPPRRPASRDSASDPARQCRPLPACKERPRGTPPRRMGSGNDCKCGGSKNTPGAPPRDETLAGYRVSLYPPLFTPSQVGKLVASKLGQNGNQTKFKENLHSKKT